MVIRMIRTYSELIKLQTFEDRYNYLKLNGQVGLDTFGFDRYLNQVFYLSPEWRKVHDAVVVRDFGCDLGIEGREIAKWATVHHMNPITVEDIVRRRDWILDPEFLITSSQNTHKAIHYGDESLLVLDVSERKPNDTCPWRGAN